jgi:integral membrane sensor domain MASE1
MIIFAGRPRLFHMISHLMWPILKTGDRNKAFVGARQSALVANLHPALIALLVAIAYYIGSAVGFFFTPSGLALSTFWPPNALLLAAFLLTPKRLWWMIVVAAFPAHLLAQLGLGVPLARSLGWFVGNTSEALLGAACIRALSKDEDLFESIRGLTIFLAFGIIVAPVLTSFFDVGVVELTGKNRDFWTLWVTRLSTNMIATLTIVPTVLFFWRRGLSWCRKVTFEQWAEGAILASGVVFVSIMAFLRVSAAPNQVPGLIALCPLPFLLWAAIRFGTGALSASMLTIALIVSWIAVHAPGAMTSEEAIERVLYMHIVLGLFAVPSMVLAAVMAERESNAELLRKTRVNLIQAQEQERQFVAHELHDDLAQKLTLLSIELDHFRTELNPSLGLRAKGLRDQMVEISEAARDLSHEVHPFTLEYLGLVGALRSLCRRAGAQNKFRLVFNESNVPPRLEPGISLCLYRVAQAALRDVTKHREPCGFVMELRIEKQRAWLQITIDDASGLSCERLHSADIGLASAGEGLMALNGTFRVLSESQSTTMIEASVPLPPS